MASEERIVLTKGLVRMIHDEAMVIPLWSLEWIRVNDGSVHDSNIYETVAWMYWTPEDAWLSQ